MYVFTLHCMWTFQKAHITLHILHFLLCIDKGLAVWRCCVCRCAVLQAAEPGSPAATHTHKHTHTPHPQRPILWPQAAQGLAGPTEPSQFKHCDPPDLGKALALMNLSMQIHPISSDKTAPHVRALRTHILQGSSGLAIHRLGAFYFLGPSSLLTVLQTWTALILRPSHSQSGMWNECVVNWNIT